MGLGKPSREETNNKCQQKWNRRLDFVFPRPPWLFAAWLSNFNFLSFNKEMPAAKRRGCYFAFQAPVRANKLSREHLNPFQPKLGTEIKDSGSKAEWKSERLSGFTFVRFPYSTYFQKKWDWGTCCLLAVSKSLVHLWAKLGVKAESGTFSLQLLMIPLHSFSRALLTNNTSSA